MPMPTTATVWDTTVMDTGMVMDTVTVSDTTDTDTVLDTVIMATVWDTTDITWARGLLMPSLKPMLMLTTADTDITAMVMVMVTWDTGITDTTVMATDMDGASKPKKLPSTIFLVVTGFQFSR